MYMYLYTYIYIFFVPSSTDGHLDCFHVLAIINSASMNIAVHVSFLIMVLFRSAEYRSGLPCPPPGDLPNPGIRSRSPALQADSLLSEPPGKPDNS